MANPPITIGPFTNVPAPGSPIRSDWAQDITHYVVDTPGMVAKTGGTMTGALVFSMGTAQQLVLLTGYALGVQSNNAYFRSGQHFAWYQGGTHSDTAFAPGAGGTELMRLTASTGLEVGRGLNYGRPVALYGDNAGSSCYLGLYDGSASPALKGFVGFNGTPAYMRVSNGMTSGTLWVEAQGNVVFQTGATLTERARFDVTGNLLVGKTVTGIGALGVEVQQATNRVWITGNDANQFSLQINGVASSAGYVFEQFLRSGTAIGSISQTGTTGVAYNVSSDRRLKTLIGPVEDAVDRVRRLKVWHFEWKDGGARQDGFVADEVAGVVPDAVSGTPDAVDDHGGIVPQQLDQSRLVPLLTAALQSTIERVTAMETRINALEAL